MNPFLRALLDQRKPLEERQGAILDEAETRVEQERASAADGVEVRAVLTEDEETRFAGLNEELRQIDARIHELQDAEERGATSARAARGIADQVTVRSEPLTYHRDRSKRSFFLDLARSKIHGDDEARQRLTRHREEMDVELPALEADKRKAFRSWIGSEPGATEQRATSRIDGAGGDFVPPIWLMELYAELPRGSRPFADTVRNIPLPGGTDSINIPRITGGTTTAMQTADNAAVSSTDMTTAVVTAPVRTIAGQQDIALQLLDQSPIAFDEVVFQDLMADCDAQVDLQCLNGSGASGQILGILGSGGTTVAYTDASPTVPELHPKLADAINQAGSIRKRPPSVMIMAWRRWLWELAALDANNRPLVPPEAQFNPLAMAKGLDLGGIVGGQLLIPILADVNMPTTLGAGTEDKIIVTKADDHLLFEGQLRTRVLPEIGSGTLTVRLQVYKYVAFTAARFPTATTIVGGTGLIAPTF